MFCDWQTSMGIMGHILEMHLKILARRRALIFSVCIVYSSTYDMCVVEITKAFPRTNFEKTRQLKKVESTTTYYKVELSLN